MAATGESEHALTQQRTAVVSIAAAALLVGLKLGVGLATGSLGLVSAGVESSGDVIAAILTFFAVRLGGRPADPEHPYGHRRAENLGALGESTILFAGGVVVAVEALRHLITDASPPEMHAYMYAVLAVAVAVDLTRMVISRRSAERYGSAALRANAFHFGADLAGSLSVFAGLLAVDAGVRQGDSIAALLVAAIICATAVRLVAENANVLMDRTPAQARAAAEAAIARLGADVELSRLRLRESAGRYFADVVVTVPPGRAVVEGHEAANEIEAALADALPGSDVVVHVEPRRRGLDARERVLAIALAEPEVLEAHDISIFEQDGSVNVSLHLKFPPELQLRAAADTARRVEQAIRRALGADAVQTHLEPLERPLAARSPDAGDEGEARDLIERVVRQQTGSRPQSVRMFATDAGRVVFLTLGVESDASLSDAHRVAGDLEDQLRQRIPDIADVVIHTQP
jgi:cation diffusion facilitator family transporter